MRYWLPLLALATSAFAEEENKQMSYFDYHPVHVGGQVIFNGNAEVENSTGGDLRFNKSNVYANILVPISQYTFFFPRVEYNIMTFDWDRNPKFNETHFHYLQFGLTCYTHALEQWRWIARVDYNIDVKHLHTPGPYSLYSWLVWGAYEIHRKWHYHIGTVGSAGMLTTNFYPLIGADYAPSSHWLIQAIFPITYSIEYKPDRHWTIAAKARPLKERFRVGTNEPQPRSVFRYSSIGTELNVQYQYENRFRAEIYGGINCAGSFYIKDQDAKNPLYGDLGSTPYIGGALDYGF